MDASALNDLLCMVLNPPHELPNVFPSLGRSVRLRGFSEVNGGPWASVAELGVIEPSEEPRFGLQTLDLEEVTSSAFLEAQLAQLCSDFERPIGRKVACAEFVRRTRE